MDYITISEMAEKWNISERMIRRYCIDGRIEGTIFKDNAWMLPENAKKPTRRTREAAKLPILVKTLVRKVPQNPKDPRISPKIQMKGRFYGLQNHI